MSDVGLVAIGRNEGERLRRCLMSVAAIPARVYVDSGSTDGSVDWAKAQGTHVVELAVPPKFTAARARNAGLERLATDAPDLAYVQMIDGDCELQPGWLEAARAAMEADPGLAGVFGRLRERFPDRSIYNAMCDEEWNIPLGEAYGFGGIVLLRIAAIRDAGGYEASIIAAEDTELARRMRDKGWRVARIDHDMALHDADITRFQQWWGRTRRSGHAFAELARRHPGSTWPNWIHICRSILFWGAALPLAALAGIVGAAALHPVLLLVTIGSVGLWLIKIAQIARTKRRQGHDARYARSAAFYLMFGKIPQLLGMLLYHRNRMLARESQLIEYKAPRAPR